MPFQSEKQRRFMWAEHPELAKRWANEYPTPRKLPMYAHDNKPDGNRSEPASKASPKEAALNVLSHAVLANNSHAVLRLMQQTVVKYSSIAKKSSSIIEYLDIPHSNEPVAAGDEHIKPKGETPANKDPKNHNKTDLMALFSKEKKNQPEGHEAAQKLASVLAKHSAVMAKKYRPRGAPQNAGLDIEKLQRLIMEDKNKALYGGNPLPLAEQAKQAPPAPDKTEQARNTAQKQPNVTSNNLMGNIIGNQGPLNSHNGKPTAQQNVTGNQAFGSANNAPGATQYGIT